MEMNNFDNEEEFDESDEYIEQGSDRQELDEINDSLEEYKNNIRNQAASIQPERFQTDYIEEFVEKELGVSDIDSVEDLSIMGNPDLTQLDKMKLDLFVNNINYTFSETLGMSLRSPDISLCYDMYRVFITNFSDYMLNYIIGLQLLGPEFEEGIPGYSELTLDYFKKKIGSEAITYKVVSDYIGYIAEQGIFPEYYFEIALLGSPGNEILTKLYLEHINDRMSIDYEFFTLKISKILLTSDEITTDIVSVMMDIIEDRGFAE